MHLYVRSGWLQVLSDLLKHSPSVFVRKSLGSLSGCLSMTVFIITTNFILCSKEKIVRNQKTFLMSSWFSELSDLSVGGNALTSPKVLKVGGFIPERQTLKDSSLKHSSGNPFWDFIIRNSSGGVFKSHTLMDWILIYALVIRCTLSL